MVTCVIQLTTWSVFLRPVQKCLSSLLLCFGFFAKCKVPITGQKLPKSDVMLCCLTRLSCICCSLQRMLNYILFYIIHYSFTSEFNSQLKLGFVSNFMVKTYFWAFHLTQSGIIMEYKCSWLDTECELNHKDLIFVCLCFNVKLHYAC